MFTDEEREQTDTDQPEAVEAQATEDPVALLEFLFGGAGALRCPDAADADDDGRLTITDAVVLLDFLFQSGEGPAAPSPDPGPDPTDDALGCAGR